MIKAAVVILNWNGRHFLEKFLATVVAASPANITKVYIADNCSTDQSVDYIKNNFPDVNIIELDRNYGFALGYKLALRQIDAEYFILLNSDVEVTDNWIPPIINFMDNHVECGACMPKIRSYNNKDYFEYAGAAGGFIDIYGYPFCRGRILNQIEQDTGQYDTVQEVFWATGACMFLRAEAYYKAGELDGDFFTHMEEIDLCWRLKNCNYSIYCLPEVSVYHIGGGTLPNNNPKKLYYNYRNSLFLLFKNLPSKKLFSILFIRLFLDGLSALVYFGKLQFGFFLAVLRAHCSFYLQITKLYLKRKKNRHMHKEFLSGIFPESIVYNFLIKNKKKFNALRPFLKSK
ncbi:MAG: glycosyltransferase family 2 protein [Bacteroidales bacterium]|nr:glycosyltransferase family 2 protein [Bacteroidales bacterium]